MEPLILSNKVEKPKYDPIKAGLYVAMLSHVEVKPMPNFETQEPEDKLSFSFKLIRPVMGGVIKDVKDVEHPPLKRFMFKAADPSFFYIKSGIKTLKVAGKIVEALGMDPFQDPIDLSKAVGKYIVLKVDVGPSFANPAILKDKVGDFIKFEGSTDDLDQIVAQANYEKENGIEPLDYSAPAQKVVETTLEEELEAAGKEPAK